jgi:hypothetical protein
MWALRGNVAGVRAGSVAAGILFRHAPAAAAIRPGGSPAVSSLLTELRQLIESGPLAHLSTINADANPQVCVIWLGVDGDDLVAPTSSATLGWFSPLTRRGSPRCSWPTGGTLVDDCARRIAVDDGGALPLDAHAAIIT